mgnify:CR=1 FL=1
MASSQKNNFCGRKKGVQGAVPLLKLCRFFWTQRKNPKLGEAAFSNTEQPLHLGKSPYDSTTMSTGPFIAPNGLGNSNVHWTEKCLLCSRLHCCWDKSLSVCDRSHSASAAASLGPQRDRELRRASSTLFNLAQRIKIIIVPLASWSTAVSFYLIQHLVYSSQK